MCLNVYKQPVVYLLWLVVLVVSCQSDGQEDIRDYYFPIQQLKDGLVYEYEALEPDSLAPYYWYYRSLIQDDAVYLSGTFYEVDLIPKQQQTELMVSNGILLEDLYLYYADSLNKQQSYTVDIVSGSLFPFKVSAEGGIFLYRIAWPDPQDPTLVTTLIKNRRYVGDTTYVYQGETYPCKVFSVKEQVEIDQEGVLEQQFDGIEFYAKGLGLVYTKKIINPSLQIAYGLVDRYPMTKLEAQFQSIYGGGKIQLQ